MITTRTLPVLSLFFVLTGSAVGGCSCKGSEVVIGPDGGKGGGADGGDAGSGGDTDGGGGGFDAGDGTTNTGVGPGGFTPEGTPGGVGGSGDGVKLDENGNIVLHSGEVQLHFAWIANNAAGTVSKYDTKTGNEAGRYHSVVPRDGLGNVLTSLRGNAANHPSRTAVDLFGDVWVANRAADNGTMGSVTKIANDLSSCVDRNGNGSIETSSDKNGDGVISTNPADGEMIFPSDWADPTQYDECILFSTEVGGTTGGVKARALAISTGLEGSAGSVWVGVWNTKSMVKLHPVTGQIQPVNAQGAMAITLPSFTSGPYGAAVDGKQRLWVVDALQSRLALIQVNGDGTATLVSDDIFFNGSTGSYGIAIDGKDRVWLAGWLGPYAARYDHSTGTWTRFDFNITSPAGTGFGRGRGIAVDETGLVFMSATTNSAGAAQLLAFDGDTGVLRPFQTATGPADFIEATDAQTHTSIGVGLDSDGHVWVNNASGNAMRIHRDTGAVLRTANQGGQLYTYSDFTGYALRKFTAPRGTYRHVAQACNQLSRWIELTWDAQVPPGTSVQVFVKVANSLADLDNSALPRYGPFTQSPVDLEAAGVPRGTYARIEFVLLSNDGQTSPVLRSFNAKWTCGDIG